MIGDIETCAAASAGASFNPSPTISTRRPCDCISFDGRDLFRRREAAAPILNAELLRYRRDGGRPIAGKHDEIKPALAKRFGHRDGVRPQGLADGDGCNVFAMREGDE